MPGEHLPQRGGLTRELVAQLEALVADGLALGQSHFQRDVAAQPRHVVVGPGDRVDADLDVESRAHGATQRNPSPCGRGAGVRDVGKAIGQGTCFRFAATYCVRALFTASRSETSGTATSHHHPPSVVVRSGSVSMQTTDVRAAARARLSAGSSSAIVFTFSDRAPIAAA